MLDFSQQTKALEVNTNLDLHPMKKRTLDACNGKLSHESSICHFSPLLLKPPQPSPPPSESPSTSRLDMYWESTAAKQTFKPNAKQTSSLESINNQLDSILSCELKSSQGLAVEGIEYNWDVPKTITVTDSFRSK